MKMNFKEMMNELKHSYIGVVLLIAGTALAACSSNDDIEEVVSQHDEPNSFYLTVVADKGNDSDNATRALWYEGSKLKAGWNTSDKIIVRHNDAWQKELDQGLHPQSNGSTSVLSGNISFKGGHTAPDVGDEFFLQTIGTDLKYSGQDGTLEKIAEKYDYANATTTITDIIDGNYICSPVTFESQQAIVLFSFMNKDNNNSAILADQIRIASSKLIMQENITNVVSTGENSDLIIKPSTPTNEIYVALRGLQDATVRVIVTAGDKTYFVEQSNVTFEHGKIYRVNLRLKERTIYYMGFAAYGDPELTFSKNPNSFSTVDNQGTVTVNSTCNFAYTKNGSCPITTGQYTTTGINLPSYWETRGWDAEGKYIFLIFPQAFFQYDDDYFYLLDPNTHIKYCIQAGDLPLPISGEPEKTYSVTIDNVPHYVTRFSNNGVTRQNWHFLESGTY